MRRLALLFAILLTVHNVLAAPDNDHFVHREPLSGTNVQFNIYRLHATREPGEPRHTPDADSRIGYASVWFTWTAPADGWVILSESFASGSLCVIYEGEDLATLTPLQRSEGSLQLKIPVIQGRTYQLAASQPATEEPPPTSQVGDARLQFFAVPVPNDNFQDRIRVAGNFVRLNGHTIGATREPGEPPHADVALPNTVWWEWTPAATGTAWIQGAPSFSGALRAYTGTAIDQLIRIPMPDTFDRFPVTAGVPVQIVVAPYAAALEGPVPLALVVSEMHAFSPTPGEQIPEGTSVTVLFTNVPPGINRITAWDPPFYAETHGNGSQIVLSNLPPRKYQFEMVASDDSQQLQYWVPPLSFTLRPGADAFALAREITPADATIGGDFAVATLEDMEPAAAVSIQGSVWWRWTAPTNGTVILCAGNYAGIIGRDIFTTNATQQLSLVPTADGGNPLAEPVSFSAEKDTTYWIRLWQHPATAPVDWASTGFVFMKTAENDNLADAAELNVSGVPVVIDRNLVSCDPAEPIPCTPGTGSRWYRFTPPAHGKFDLSLEGWFSIEHLTSVAVFTGPLDALTLVSNPALRHSIELEGSRTYYFRVQTPLEFSEGIQISLTATFGILPPNDNVANALLIAPESGEIHASTYLATREVDENPTVAGLDSIWYRFQAPHEGTLAVRVARTPTSYENYYPQVSFARGSSAATLTWADDQARWGNIAAIDLNPGDEILLSVWANHIIPESNLDFVLEYFFVPRPANDDFSDRILLEGTDLSFRGTNWNATAEPGEAAGNFSPARSIWWEWIAPATGALEVETDHTAIDLFSGSETNLVLFASTMEQREFAGGFVFAVIAGERYFLRASENASIPFDDDGFSDFEINLRLGTSVLISPTNQAVYFQGQPITLEATALLTNINGNAQSATFFRGTNAFFSTADSLELGTVLDLPYRLVLTNLFPGHHLIQAVITNDAGESFPTAVAKIRVAPGNDELTNAFVLNGRYTEETAFLSGSTQNGDTGVSPQNGTVWYQWTPPVQGRIRWTASAGSITDLFGSTNSIASVTNITNLRSIGRLNNSSSFTVSPTTNYWIRINAPTNGIGRQITTHFTLEQTTISFSAPANGFVAPAGSPVTIRLATTEPSGQISGVALFHGTNQLATLSEATNFEYVWSNPSIGRNQLVAYPLLASGEMGPSITNTFNVRAPHDAITSPELLSGVSGSVSGTWAGSTSTNNSAPKDLWYQFTPQFEGILFASFTNSSGDLKLYIPVEGTNGTSWIEQENLGTPFGSFAFWKVYPGTNYFLGAYGDATANGSFQINFQLFPRTQNDDFANRMTLVGTNGQVTTEMSMVSLEPTEPVHNEIGLTVAGSAWYTWTPPFDGLLALSSTNANIAQFAVRPWTGETLDALAKIPVTEGWDFWFGGPVYYPVRGGVPVHFSVVTTMERLSTIPWNWSLTPFPVNDRYTNRTQVSGQDLVLEGALAGATREPLDGSLFSTVWWSWTAQHDGYLRMQLTEGPGVEAVAYLGKTPQTFDTSQRIFSHVPTEWRVRPGDVLDFQIGGPLFMESNFELRLQMTAMASNDQFADRQAIIGTNLQWEADNRLATREFREPNHAGLLGGRSLWYKYTPQRSGTIKITRESYSENLLVAAYEGPAVTNLTPVASAHMVDDAFLSFDVQAGKEYAIAVDNAWGYSGPTTLKLNFTSAPPPVLAATIQSGGTLFIEAPDTSEAWQLEQSSDLLNWQSVQSVEGNAWTIDPQSEGATSALFYRLRLAD